MKKTFLSVLLLLITFSLFSQFNCSCLPDGIQFTSQSQIDSFQINYPGCTKIEGDVSIGLWGIDDITNLNGLNELDSIGGDLDIKYCSVLVTLNGLGNLTFIGGNLNIEENDLLSDITGLESLSSISKSFELFRMNSIISLAGLENLNYIGENFSIHSNDSITSLNGFEGLNYIGGYIFIHNNKSLTTLSGLDNLNSISGFLSITENDSLSECEAFGICNFLSNPNSSINIRGNSEGCASMIEVALACETTIPCDYGYNASLFSQFDVNHFHEVFLGCSDLECSIGITGNDITNLDSLIFITNIGGGLAIYNTELVELQGLSNIQEVNGSLSIGNNNSLINLSGLDTLNNVGGDFIISYGDGTNDNLTNLFGINNLTTIGGECILGGPLTSISALNNLSFIGGSLNIGATGLTDIDGFMNLDTIGGDLSFFVEIEGMKVGNEHLTSLSGLSSLKHVFGALKIFSNPILIDISGLENISATSLSAIDIRYNDLLSTCNITAICDFIANPNGDVLIDNNSEGCNSQEEVEEACEISFTSETGQIKQVLIYPNPAQNNIQIEGIDNQEKQINIYNTIGQKIFTKKNCGNRVNISMIKSGICILEVITDNTVFREQLIIQ